MCGVRRSRVHGVGSRIVCPQQVPTPCGCCCCRCWLYGVGPVGQTPIYDRLRGERINAHVLPSRADQHGHSGRSCLDEHMPGAAAVVVGPSGPRASAFPGLGREDSGTGSLAEAGGVLWQDFSWASGPRHQPRQSFEEDLR